MRGLTRMGAAATATPTRTASGVSIPDALVDALRPPLYRPTGLPTTARFPTTNPFRRRSCGREFGTTLSGAWRNGIYAADGPLLDRWGAESWGHLSAVCPPPRPARVRWTQRNTGPP